MTSPHTKPRLPLSTGLSADTIRYTAVICAILLTTLFSGLATAPLAAQAIAPSLTVDHLVLDLGSVTRGEKPVATFVLENQGSATLEIYSVRSSCECAVVNFPSSIEKGAKAELTVEVDTTSLSGPSGAEVRLETNDPDTPFMQLTIKLNSEDILGAHPPTLRFVAYQDFLGEGVLSETIFAEDGADFKILGIETHYPFLTTSEVVPAPDNKRIPNIPGPQWQFSVRLDNNPPVGALRGHIIVLTDHPTQKKLAIPLSGFIRPLVAVTPPSLKLKKFALSDKGRTVEVHVKQFAEEPMRIEKVECDIEGIKVQFVEDKPGRVWRVRVFVPPSQEPGPFKGTITLHTSSDRKKTVLIPISGTVLPPSNSEE